MNGARRLGRAVAADSAGERKLLEEFAQPGEIFTLLRVDLGISAFQVARPEDTLGATIRRLTAGHGLALIPVTEGGRVVGIVSVQNLMSSMSLLAEQRRIERQQEED